MCGTFEQIGGSANGSSCNCFEPPDGLCHYDLLDLDAWQIQTLDHMRKPFGTFSPGLDQGDVEARNGQHEPRKARTAPDINGLSSIDERQELE